LTDATRGPRVRLRRRLAAVYSAHLDRPRIDRPLGPANPYEAWVFVVCFLAGAATLVGAALPSSLDDAVTSGFRWLWAALLAAGAAAALAGLYWPGDQFTAMYVKRAGILALAGALLAYGVALFALGRSGVVVGLETVGLAVASLHRVRQITIAAARARQSAVQLEAIITPPGGIRAEER
jgi:hypothetical protein